MAPEIDDEIAQHLLDKITHAIEHPTEQNNLVTKLFSFESEFKELKNKLESTTNQIHGDKWLSVRRENLYRLNDLLTEWTIIKKHNSFSLVEDREAGLNIRKRLKEMKKKVISGEESSSKGDHEHSLKYKVFKRNKDQVYRWSSRHGPRKVHGFEQKVMAMERELVMRNIDAPFKVFGIVGVAGIGKTALCQTIFGRESVKEHFSPRIWVCLSKQPREDDPEQPGKNDDVKKPKDDDMKQPNDPKHDPEQPGKNDDVKKPKDDDMKQLNDPKHDPDQPENDDVKKPKDNDVKQPNDPKQRKEIVVRILEGLGIEDEVISDAGNDNDGNGLRRLILLLRLQLIGKRYLIVLDDAWNHNEFFLKLNEKEQLDEKWGEELAYALPKGCGGSVISTSRSDALLKKMLGKDVGLQYLKPYVDKEKEIIYDIFKDTVIGDENEKEFPQHLEELKAEILKKCDGIPLAAKLLAKIAREQPMVIQKQAPATSAGRGQEKQLVSASSFEKPRGGGADAGSDGGVQDGEHKGDLLPKKKAQERSLSDQMAKTTG